MEVDFELEFSCENFAKRLARSQLSFDRDNGVLNNADHAMSSPHPSPALLAQFAKAAYVQMGGNEEHLFYQCKLQLPRGWELLTTAHNGHWKNGYFGAAYWSPSLQQVILAHRGTVPTNPGAMRTNVTGVVFKNYSPRINSAATFADKVRCAINEANKHPGKQYQLSITGHSLGGWLAQLTGLSVKHLNVEDGKFIKPINTGPRDGLHAHVVVFDSPGCKDMLEEIVDSYWCRHGKKVSLESLDISSYQSAPNMINTFGLHVGSIYRVMVDVSKFSMLDRKTLKYTLATHDIANLTDALLNNLKIHEMKDWPSSKIREVLHVFGKTEYKSFHQKVSHADEYHLDPAECDEGSMEVRYKEKRCDNSGSLRMFSDDELKLLHFLTIFERENVKINRIEEFLRNHNLGNWKDFFVNFSIDCNNRTIACDSREDLVKVIRQTKLLMRWFPAELMAAVDRQSGEIPKIIYAMANQNYLDSLPECFLDFTDSIGLREFLQSDHRILQIKSEDCDLEMLRLFSIARQLREPSSDLNKYVNHGWQTFIRSTDLKNLELAVTIENLPEDFTNDNLLVINCASMDVSRDLGREQMFKPFLDSIDKKLILVYDSKMPDLDSFLDIPVSVGQLKTFDPNQLTQDSKKKLFEKKILDIGDKILRMADFMGEINFNTFTSEINTLINTTDFKNILKNNKHVFKIENLRAKLIDSGVNFSTVGKEVSVESVAKTASSDDLLVVGGSPPHEVREKLTEAIWVSEKGNAGEEKFKQIVSENPNKKVYWLEANDCSTFITVKQIYHKNLYMRRRFHHRVMLKLEDFAAWSEVENICIVQNLPEMMREKYPKIENILTAASDAEVYDILKKNDKKSIHLLKFEEKSERFMWKCLQGSFKSLHTYIRCDTDHAVDEEELYMLKRKVLIIADEPGMGKSTSLASMARMLRLDLANWVIWIKLKHFRIPSEDMRSEPKERCEFLLRKNLAKNNFPFELLQFCMHHEHSRQVYFMFDGFDEMKDSNGAKTEALKLLNYLSEKTFARVWVTTRFHERELLEHALSRLAVTLERIEERQQREYLVNFWRSHLLLEPGGCGDEKLRKLQECALDLYTAAKVNLGSDIQGFMGVPLQMRMLADVFLEQVENYVMSQKVGNSFKVENVFSLYTKFIEVKYSIYATNKTILNVAWDEDHRMSAIANFTHSYRMLALRTLFPDFAEEHCERTDRDVREAELCRIGLVQSGGDGTQNIEFLHRTLAEYFCADQVVLWLSKKGPCYGRFPALELLLTDILLQNSHKVIRRFINDFLLQHPTLDLTRDYATLQNGKLCNKPLHLLINEYGKTALHMSTEENNTGIINLLIDSLGIEQQCLIGFLEAPGACGITALCRAAGDGQLAMVQYLIQKGGDINSANANGWNALHLAAFKGQIAVVQYLVDKGGDINLANKYGNNTLHIAAMEGHLPVVQYSIERGGDINSINEYSNNVLHLAAYEGQLPVVKYLVENGGDINVANKDGNNALHLAAMKGHMSVVQYLVRKGGGINSANKNGGSALHLAAIEGHLPVVKYLTENGGEINSVTKIDCTALHLAAREGHVPVVRYLVDNGGDVDLTDIDGNKAFHIAAHNGHIPVVRYLVEQRGDINCANRNGDNALHLAAYNGHVLMVQYVVEKGGEVNSVDNVGHNALHKAAYNGHLPMVQYLLKKGVNVNSKDKDGNDALYLAAYMQRLPVVQYLVENGGDVYSANKCGCTALNQMKQLWSAGNIEEVSNIWRTIVQSEQVRAPQVRRSPELADHPLSARVASSVPSTPHYTMKVDSQLQLSCPQFQETLVNSDAFFDPTDGILETEPSHVGFAPQPDCTSSVRKN